MSGAVEASRPPPRAGEAAGRGGRYNLHAPAHPDAGSVLVEAMVAVAVLALVLGVAYRTIGESVLRARASEAKLTATLVARSRLAAVGSDIPLAEGDARGVDGGFAWSVHIESFQQGDSAFGRLEDVSVSVRRPGDHTDLVTLRQLEMAPAGAAAG